MSRANRWWRPTPRNVRPPVRARRSQVSRDDALRMFDLGYQVGWGERGKQRDDLLARLADAVTQSRINDLAKEMGVLDDAGNMLPEDPDGDSLPDHPEQLLDEVERWLREHRDGTDEGDR